MMHTVSIHLYSKFKVDIHNISKNTLYVLITMRGTAMENCTYSQTHIIYHIPYGFCHQKYTFDPHFFFIATM